MFIHGIFKKALVLVQVVLSTSPLQMLTSIFNDEIKAN